ncbi:IS5/IS1182 family transposase, partial [Streptococcus uberis]|nr:IS5/IS1182 family transposase [Streptococcus uberis]
AFPALWKKLESFHPNYIIADSGYKTPSIAKLLLDNEVSPVFPYTRPHGKKGNLRPNDFIYDSYYNCYLCPENQVLSYATTNRSG